MASPYRVPLISQATPELCWEASGRMMWLWKHQGERSTVQEAGYRSAAGTFTRINRGLSDSEALVYYNALGLRQARTVSKDIVKKLLAGSPVVFSDVNQARGHAMVAIYYCPVQRIYTVNNPCGVQSMNIASGGGQCTATAVVLPAQTVEGNLGAFVWHWPS
jgi:hypothetical protein